MPPRRDRRERFGTWWQGGRSPISGTRNIPCLPSFGVLGTYLALDWLMLLLNSWNVPYNMLRLLSLVRVFACLISLVSSAFDPITSSYWPIAPVCDNIPVKQSANGRRKKGRVYCRHFPARPFLLLFSMHHPTPIHSFSTHSLASRQRVERAPSQGEGARECERLAVWARDQQASTTMGRRVGVARCEVRNTVTRIQEA